MSSTAGRWGAVLAVQAPDCMERTSSFCAGHGSLPYRVSPMGFTAGIDPEFQMACAVWRISMASSSRPSGARPSWYGWSVELFVDSSMCACS